MTDAPIDFPSPQGMPRSPRTLAEWKLCKPGDTIELMGLTVPITEQNYESFMNELMWYVNYGIGYELGDWILPNRNPGSLTKVSDFMTKTYITTGIYGVLHKYAINRPSFWQSMRQMFRGGG